MNLIKRISLTRNLRGFSEVAVVEFNETLTETKLVYLG